MKTYETALVKSDDVVAFGLDAMKTMAELMRGMSSRLKDLEEQVRRLEKVTPAQASALNRAITARAATVCQLHRAAGCEKSAAAAIRKAVKRTCGIQSMRELPRCDFSVAQRQIELWDDYGEMKRIKAKAVRA